MIAVLYAQGRGCYSRLPGVDLWDVSRDARRYGGPYPVVAHPPCRMWGKYKAWAKGSPGERDLAFHALAMVRRYGGVLEHPVGSTFFREAGIPPGDLVRLNQSDFGHRAEKATYLYVVGCSDLPPFPPPRPGVIPVEKMWRGEREATPLPFAQFLLEIARRSIVS